MADSCAQCGKGKSDLPAGEKLKTCGLCKMVFYCGQDCQKTHWKGGHKKTCLGKKTKPISKNEITEKVLQSLASAQIRTDPDAPDWNTACIKCGGKPSEPFSGRCIKCTEDLVFDSGQKIDRE